MAREAQRQPFLNGLNSAQREAVTCPSDVLQILAPPGSGKTTTLTSRVAYLLIHNDYEPRNVIVATFTVKAAREMKARLGDLIGQDREAKLVLGTFHSIARRFLVRHGHLIGIHKSFGIADTSDSLAIIKRINKRRKLNIDPGRARSRISSNKSRGISLEKFQSSGKKTLEAQEILTAYEEYEMTLRRSNLLDYDDLLLRCTDLLRQHPSCVSTIEAVLVDEFQDTNLVQFELTTLLAAHKRRVTCVGDPDQSIYGFRNADIENLGRMQRQYPNMTAIHLEENYRSSGAILLSALEVIQQDSSRPKKPLLPTHTVGTMPVLRKLSSAACEARWVVSEIKRLIAVTGNMLSFSDFAILIRSGPLSRQIESALGKSSVPYVYVGGHKFFDRHEIKVVLGYLRTISQPDNSDALVRILNVPPRRIGEATIQRLLEAAESQQTTLWSLIKESLSGKRQFPLRVTKVARSGFSSLQALIEKAQSRFLGREADGVQLTNMLLFLIKELSLKEYLVKTYPDDHETRWANVEELVAMASDVSQTASSNGRRDASPILPDASGEDGITTTADALSELLTNIALSAGSLQRDGETTQPKVMLSTIHAAKGLEWPVVFVVGAYDGSIPHSRAENHDEERRLLYVAMTRAQALLYVSVPANNSMQGPTTTSPFLSHHAVKKHLATKGPSISYDALQSVASILGRVCPSEANIRIACRDLESREDDVWPINGTSTFLNGDGFETYEDADCSLALYRDAKRRCTGQQNHSAIWGPSKADSNGNGRLSTLAGHSKFSVPSTTMHIGFVSAASHLSKLDEYCSARVAAGLAGQPSSHKAKISSVTALQHPTSATTIRLSYHKPGGEETVQGSPACFSAWKKLPKDAKDLEEKEKNKESRPPCSSFRVPRALEFVAPEDIVNSTAAGWHPSVHTEDDLATAMMPQSVARANALSMSDRRVRNAPVSLPRLEGCSNIGSGEKENPYVFLSSPTSDDSVATKASRPLRDISANSSPSRHSISKLSESQARVSSSTKNAEAVNSKFIHPTKRTLGMRRSINGWK